MRGGERAQPLGQIALGGAGLAQRGVAFGDARELARVFDQRLLARRFAAGKQRLRFAEPRPRRGEIRGQLGALPRRRVEFGAEALGVRGLLAQRGRKARPFGAAGLGRRRRRALAVRQPDLEASARVSRTAISCDSGR